MSRLSARNYSRGHPHVDVCPVRAPILSNCSRFGPKLLNRQQAKCSAKFSTYSSCSDSNCRRSRRPEGRKTILQDSAERNSASPQLPIGPSICRIREALHRIRKHTSTRMCRFGEDGLYKFGAAQGIAESDGKLALTKRPVRCRRHNPFQE